MFTKNTLFQSIFSKPILLRVGLMTAGLLCAFGVSAQPLKLQQLFDIATQNNPELSYLQANQDLSLAKYQESEALLKPQVRLISEFSYAWMEMNNFPRFANQVAVSYPLYDPMLQDGKLIASTQYDIEIDLLEAGRQKAWLQVSQQYFNYWKQQAALHYLEQEKDYLYELLFQVESRLELGMQDLDDMAKVQSRIDRNRSQRIEAQKRLALLKNNLREVLGINDRPDIEVEALAKPAIPQQAPLFVTDLLEDSLSKQQLDGLIQSQDQQWQRLVLGNPLVEALQKQWQAAQQKIHQKQQVLTPKVEAFGALVYNESDRNFYDDMRGFRGGVRINAPLYLGGQASAEVAQARAEADKIAALQRKQENALITMAMNAWLELQSAYENYDVQQQALKTARCTLEAIEQALISGSSDIIELLEAQKAVYQAQSALPDTEAEIGLQRIKFYWAIGRLNPGIT
ncbi:TolC family protein [Thiomicrorhabdus sp.]|uniref:TolC family protein n=1 Tax=Thiomicrorhabdus sp. TaxID=2039724 RepID=UPI0029C632E3|nr:TolC family protein [Thiomicrorhabdus sp.]